MELSQAILGRRTVREYASTPVGKETIEHLIASAIAAPSAMNEQPWSFTVVCDRSVLDELARKAKAHVLAGLPPAFAANRHHARG